MVKKRIIRRRKMVIYSTTKIQPQNHALKEKKNKDIQDYCSTQTLTLTVSQTTRFFGALSKDQC
jgi:hypothetical protein